MASEPSSKQGSAGAQSREDRLKAALKANMAKRKAQARARKVGDDDKTAAKTGE